MLYDSQARYVTALRVALVESARRQETDNKRVSAILTVIFPGLLLFLHIYIVEVFFFIFLLV